VIVQVLIALRDAEDTPAQKIVAKAGKLDRTRSTICHRCILRNIGPKQLI
jgi:hypothetical protein